MPASAGRKSEAHCASRRDAAPCHRGCSPAWSRWRKFPSDRRRPAFANCVRPVSSPVTCASGEGAATRCQVGDRRSRPTINRGRPGTGQPARNPPMIVLPFATPPSPPPCPGARETLRTAPRSPPAPSTSRPARRRRKPPSRRTPYACPGRPPLSCGPAATAAKKFPCTKNPSCNFPAVLRTYHEPDASRRYAWTQQRLA